MEEDAVDLPVRRVEYSVLHHPTKRLSTFQKLVLVKLLEVLEDLSVKLPKAVLPFEDGDAVPTAPLLHAITWQPERHYTITGEAGVFAQLYFYFDRTLYSVLRGLHRRGLITKHYTTFGGRLMLYVGLTERGRKVAEALKERYGDTLLRMLDVERSLKHISGNDMLDGAIKHLKKRFAEEGKPPLATPQQLLDAIWETEHDVYGNFRELFDEHWNKRRLSREMDSRGYKLVLKRVDGKRVYVYELVGLEDLKVALYYLVAVQRSFQPDYANILTALWVTSEPVQSKEDFAKYWTRKRVGKLMAKLGFKLTRRQLIKIPERLYDVREVANWKPSPAMLEAVDRASAKSFLDEKRDFLKLGAGSRFLTSRALLPQ